MLLPSEIEAKTVIPYLRAVVAKRLMEVYGLNQQQVAAKLGLTQAAVSNYIRQTRGKRENWQREREIEMYCDVIASMIANGADEIEILDRFNEATKFIRKNRLLCDIHKELEPDFDIESCHICDRPNP